MKKSTIKKIVNNPTCIGLFAIGILILFLLFSLVFKSKEKSGVPIKEGQIQIVKGDEVITVNLNGLVEYRSKDKTYTETWDLAQINSFFTMMETKARDYLTRRVSGGDCGYKVYMFIDRKLVTVCMDSEDRDMSEYVGQIFIKYSDIDLTDYFEDSEDEGNGNDDEEVFEGVVNFPTSTPGITRSVSTPTPTPISIHNINTNYAPIKADCETWSGAIVKNRAIISNTYCTVDSTPTPAP